MHDFTPAALWITAPFFFFSPLKWLSHFFFRFLFFLLHDFKCLHHNIVRCEKDEIDFDAHVEFAERPEFRLLPSRRQISDLVTVH